MIADNTHYANPTSGTSGLSFDKLGSVWMERVKKANSRHQQWSDRNKCDKLERYYCGEQWEPTGSDYEPYVINLVFATIQVQLPTLLFDNPVYHLKPKPKGMAYDPEMAIKKSLLREDLLNTFIGNEDLAFAEEIEQAVTDSFFRFGIIEVGYNANWIENPNAGKPILRSDNQPYVDSRNNVIKQPAEIPEEERIYVKRIPAKRFRVGGLEASRLERCSWCGYWEYVRIEDFKANKALKNLEYLVWSGTRSDDFVPEEYGPEVDHLVKSGDLLKIWHIWDLRKKMKYVFSDSQQLTHYEKKYERLPLFDLRPNKLFEGWYPLPPVRNWKPAQDELNDSHEQMRNHRKRFTRKYIYNKAAFTEEEELDKLVNGGDGTFAGTDAADVRTTVAPMPNADLGAQEGQSLVVSKDDFNIISGASSEAKGQADKMSATQANIISQRQQVRDSRQRIQVARFLARIGKEVLLLAEEKLTMPIWVKMSTPATANADGGIPFIWHQITMEDLSSDGAGFDFDVDISLDSMSPIENDNEKQKFLLFLAVLNQNPELSESPDLVREAAYRCGYRNEKVIAQMQQVAQLKLKIQMAQLGMAATQATQPPQQQPNPQNLNQGAVAQATPPDLEQVIQQLIGAVQ